MNIEKAAEAAYYRFCEVHDKRRPVEWDSITIAQRNDWKDAVEAAALFLQDEPDPCANRSLPCGCTNICEGHNGGQQVQPQPVDGPNVLIENYRIGLDKVIDQRNRIVAMDIPDPACSSMRDEFVTALDILCQVLSEHFPLINETQFANRSARLKGNDGKS